MQEKKYDYRNCASLFGYAAKVHNRSGGICALCDCGSNLDVASEAYFDLWRQMSVEHLIGNSQGGYLADIQKAVIKRFPQLLPNERNKIAKRIDAANTVTACQFCNSSTSHIKSPSGMEDLLINASGNHAEEVVDNVIAVLKNVLDRKQEIMAWKLQSVRTAYQQNVEPELDNTRLKLKSA